MSRTRLENQGGAGGVAPEFLVSPEALDAVSPSGDRGGMMLGATPQGEPLSMSILRAEPTRIVMVGGLYLARQLALRAMATGAWVIVATGRPQAWQVLARAAGQRPDGGAVPLVQIRRLVPVELPRATEDGPLLVIHDGGAAPQEMFPPRSAWQTTVYVLPYLHPNAMAVANTADLVLLQRMPMGQAQMAARTWRLGPQHVQQLATMKNDAVVALGANLWQPLRLISNAREQQILGPVRLGD